MNTYINERLIELSETSYKEFNCKIIPTNYPMQGIRIPALRALAKELGKEEGIQTAYLDSPELDTYEKIILYGMTLSYVKKISIDEVFKYLDALIPLFDNWAHVDCVVSEFKIFKKEPDKVLAHYLPLRNDEGEFTKRFFVILLLSFYVNDKYIDQVLMHLQKVPQGQYYVDMAIAWTLSVGLIKYYDKTIPLFEQHTFSKFVHNKAIQKARESFRVSAQTKEFLNGLKMK